MCALDEADRIIRLHATVRDIPPDGIQVDGAEVDSVSDASDFVERRVGLRSKGQIFAAMQVRDP